MEVVDDSERVLIVLVALAKDDLLEHIRECLLLLLKLVLT